MSFIRIALTTALIAVVALPTSAGAMSFDLPRLDFEAPETPTQTVVKPVLPLAPK
ncbi:hypothetical protein [Aliiroseovarius sp. YM-037]|uniref:hypothetical protein n=1 Tax=Aliiroseovarius sp. YM-037 TaxID=3341728 RepID=UPI003A804F8B